MTNTFSKILVTTLLAVGATSASATSFQVDVGYADTIRSSPYTPSPWDGSPNSIFAGGSGGDYDAGAIEIINTGSTPITFNDLNVSGFGSGASFDIWGAWTNTSIGVGQRMIFTQTSSYNFDTSDYQGSNTAAIPAVTFTIDGVTYSYNDTAQVLNTEGTDWLAATNESHQWREIGTYGGQAAVPEPEIISMFAIGLLGIAVARNKKA